MGGLAEIRGGDILGEEKIPDKEHRVHERTELDRPAVAGALFLLAVLEAEEESNGDQAGNVVGSCVVGASCRGNNEVHNSQEDGHLSLDRGIFMPVRLELLHESLVDPSV